MGSAKESNDRVITSYFRTERTDIPTSIQRIITGAFENNGSTKLVIAPTASAREPLSITGPLSPNYTLSPVIILCVTFIHTYKAQCKQ